MTDKTERKVRQWVTRKNGDPVTMRDVIELVLASDDDSVERHEETIREIGALKHRFSEHCAQGDERDRRITELEGWRATCPAMVKEQVETHHQELHGRHMTDDHAQAAPATSDSQTERQTWVMWGVGMTLLKGVAVPLLASALTALFFYLITKGW